MHQNARLWNGPIVLRLPREGGATLTHQNKQCLITFETQRASLRARAPDDVETSRAPFTGRTTAHAAC
eukprot:3627925-Pyramimonas_sp.AAC.1